MRPKMNNNVKNVHRRSHTKSRMGCVTCKHRHIRCDEGYPQCQNCTKHMVRCTFHDVSAQGETLPRTSCQERKNQSIPVIKSGRRWSANIRAEVRQWRRSGSMPVPGADNWITLQPAIYSEEELCYIYQAARKNHQLAMMDAQKLTVLAYYAPSFLRAASTSRLAMNGLLALSAYQVALANECQFARHRAYQYQMMAIRDLRQAVTHFSRDNADGTLAASMALLWLSEDMPSRSQISGGISAILKVCHDLGHKSDIFEIMAKAWPGSTGTGFVLDWHPNLRTKFAKSNVLRRIIIEMQKFMAVLRQQEPDGYNAKQLQLLVVLAHDLAKLNPSTPAGEQFECMRLLRDYVLWLPVNNLTTGKNLPGALMVNNYLYMIVLYIYRQFSPASATEPGVDIVSIMDKTMRRVAASGLYSASLTSAMALISSME